MDDADRGPTSLDQIPRPGNGIVRGAPGRAVPRRIRPHHRGQRRERRERHCQCAGDFMRRFQSHQAAAAVPLRRQRHRIAADLASRQTRARLPRFVPIR